MQTCPQLVDVFLLTPLLISEGSRKKNLNGRAIKRGEGGRRGKGPAIKEKIFFFTMLLPFKNKNYFTLDNLSKYGHIITLYSLTLGIFSGL